MHAAPSFYATNHLRISRYTLLPGPTGTSKAYSDGAADLLLGGFGGIIGEHVAGDGEVAIGFHGKNLHKLERACIIPKKAVE